MRWALGITILVSVIFLVTIGTALGVALDGLRDAIWGLNL